MLYSAPAARLGAAQLEAVPSAEPRRLLIHEVPVRTWLSRLALGSGDAGDAARPLTLAEVPDAELERFARLGADFVWLMGVWPSGPFGTAIARQHAGLLAEYRRTLPDFTLADVGGSPFAMAGTEVDPRLGGPGGPGGAPGAAQVPRSGVDPRLRPQSHRGRPPLVRHQPSLYVQGTAGDLASAPGSFFAAQTVEGPRVIAHGRDPYFPAWTDTAQLDYAQLGTARRPAPASCWRWPASATACAATWRCCCSKRSSRAPGATARW